MRCAPQQRLSQVLYSMTGTMSPLSSSKCTNTATCTCIHTCIQKSINSPVVQRTWRSCARVLVSCSVRSLCS